jgi:hypothetical protein
MWEPWASKDSQGRLVLLVTQEQMELLEQMAMLDHLDQRELLDLPDNAEKRANLEEKAL